MEARKLPDVHFAARMHPITLSKAELAAACPGSHALPWYGSESEASSYGNAAHEWIGAAVVNDFDFFDPSVVDVLLRELGDRWNLGEIDRARLAKLARTFRPAVPSHGIAEQALAFLADGTVVEAVGGRGKYEPIEGAIAYGSLDYFWAEQEPLVHTGDITPPRVLCPDTSTLCVVDWKTSIDHVRPAAVNMQIRFAALMAARWTGATRVQASICLTSEGPGGWESVTLEAADLDAIEAELRTVVALAEIAADPAAPFGPDLRTGPQCLYCPARAGCPAQIGEAAALVRAYGELPAKDAEAALAMLGDDVLGEAIVIAKRMDTLSARIIAEGKRRGRVPIAGGREFSPVVETRKEHPTRATFEALIGQLEGIFIDAEVSEWHTAAGALADAAFKTSKDAIFDALRAAKEKSGGKVNMSAIYRAICERAPQTERAVEVWSIRDVAPVQLAPKEPT